MTSKEETSIQRDIQLKLTDARTRLFRNNVGGAWQGSDFTVKNRRLFAGAARFVKYGLAESSSDLIGFRMITVTPEMVGRSLAVFLAIEVKTQRGSADAGQSKFVDVVSSLGGAGAVVRSLDEARSIIHQLDT